MSKTITPLHNDSPPGHSGVDADLAKRREVAEITKLELEARELEARLGRRWFEARFVVQSVIGGIVAAGLLAAWMIQYAQPILSKKQELASIQADIQEKTNAREHLTNEERTSALQKENSNVREQLISLKASNEQLAKHQNDASQHAIELEKRLASREQEIRALIDESTENSVLRKKLLDLSASTVQEKQALRGQITDLRTQQEASQQRALTISSSLTANTLMNTVWRRQCPECNDQDKEYLVQFRGTNQLYVAKGADKPHPCYGSVQCNWTVENNVLVLAWAYGVVEKYPFPSSDATVVKGTRTSSTGVEAPVTLARIQAAGKAD